MWQEITDKITENDFNIFLSYICLIPNVTTACHYTAPGHPNCHCNSRAYTH